MSSLIDTLDIAKLVESKTDAELVAGLSEAQALQSTPFDHLQKLRMLAFPRLAEKILDPEGKMHAWASRMALAAGQGHVVLRPGTPFTYALPWLAAFAVIYRGEAPAAWPQEWTDEHVSRAARWESGEQIPVWVSGKPPKAPGQVVTATLS